MRASVRERLNSAASAWGRNLLILGLTVFLARMGQGLVRGVSTNFYVDLVGLTGGQVLWLAGIREIPGLSLMFIALLIARLPLSRRAAVALAVEDVPHLPPPDAGGHRRRRQGRDHRRLHDAER